MVLPLVLVRGFFARQWSNMMTSNIFYAGIGSRETPDHELSLMYEFAREAHRLGAILRSGAAPGADQQFETGCDTVAGNKQIFIPWNGFEKRYEGNGVYLPVAESGDLAAKVHPYYRTMKAPNKLLISRNMHQIMGPDLTEPADFVICWTPDGCESHLTYSPQNTGGTGSAIALASLQKIPVFNLYHTERLWEAMRYLDTLKQN